MSYCFFRISYNKLFFYRDENVPILVRAADDERPPDIVTTSLPSNAVHYNARHKNSRHSGVANDKGFQLFLSIYLKNDLCSRSLI